MRRGFVFTTLFKKIKNKDDQQLKPQLLPGDIPSHNVEFFNIHTAPTLKLDSRQALVEHLRKPLEKQHQLIEVDLHDKSIPNTKGSYGVLLVSPEGRIVTRNTNGTRHGPIHAAVQEANDLHAKPGGERPFSIVDIAAFGPKPKGAGAQRTPIMNRPGGRQVSDIGGYSPRMFGSAAAGRKSVDPTALVTSFKQDVSSVKIPMGNKGMLEQTTTTKTTTVSRR
jgi:hypothetical protein